jgi:cytosine/adenosine deaminase-related metal-dependent hydrolase
LDDAFRAHTINAAKQMFRDKDLGSITVGKLADLVQLSADPYSVDADKLTNQVTVQGTWVSGKKIDPDAFVTQIEAMDPSEHQDLPHTALSHTC